MIRTPGHLLRTLACLATLSVIASPALAQQPLRGLDAYAEKALADWGAPSVAIAVVKDGQVVHARAYGVRTLGEATPADENTLYAVASTTKAYTAAAIGMLVDEGKLSWDDRVVDHLPGFQLYDPYVTAELTVRDLLTHRSGLSRGDRLWYASPHDRDEIVRRIRHLEPSWSFRSNYGYQNVMFLVAGEVVEAVTGKTWDAFIEERIFGPLGMDRSTTSADTVELRSNVATPYELHDGRLIPVAWPDMDNAAPAGSIASSVREIAEWMKLQLAEGEYAGRRLISEDVVREMHAPQMVIRMGERSEELFPETHFQAYGLGWSLRDYRGAKIVQHGGALDGMRTQVALVPEHELGVVAITNMDASLLPQAMVFHVIDQYLGPRDKDWSRVMLARHQEGIERADSTWNARVAERAGGTAPSLPLDRYAGLYESEMYGPLRITRAGDGLRADMGPRTRGDLEHWHHDTFLARWDNPAVGRAFLTFRLDPRGRITGLEWEDLGEFERRDDEGAAAAGQN